LKIEIREGRGAVILIAAGKGDQGGEGWWFINISIENRESGKVEVH
jgi:hypothetical protein